MFKEHSTEEIINLIEEHQLEKDAEAISKAVDEAFKNKQNLNVLTDKFDMDIKNDCITINAKKQDNHTLEDLKQKLINQLYSYDSYEKNDVELIKILFENSNTKKD